ncbi:MAG: FAD-binding oxidoreductase [Thermoplasmata archaeon]|nr:FAD-binding oxidoreductase [Thermoplasmata archaeon]
MIDSLGETKVLWKDADLASYSMESNIQMMRAVKKDKYSPDFVILPTDTHDVQKAVRIAAQYRIPIISKGGGSNLCGMLVPLSGGIILDTIKMNKILEVNKPNLYVTVQPGITLKELEENLARQGLALNQIQGSYKVATVGGSISTSGFPRKHAKYGTIADRIMSLEVVLANGEILRTGQKVLYTSTGYRLHQLFVGAEGTLGIITEATIRVEPRPERQEAIMAYYDNFKSALDAVIKIKTSGVTFVSAEAFTVPKEWYNNTPEGKDALIIADFEGTEGEVEAEVAFVKNIVNKTGGVSAPAEDAQNYVDGYQMIWCGTRAMEDIEGDVICPYIPIENLIEFYDKLWDEIMSKYGIVPSSRGERCGLDCGRYEMAYATFKLPELNENPEYYEKAKLEIAELVTSLGGSVAACMGVGVKYRDFLKLEFSEVALDTMRKIKAVLDPDNIMNPGKKIPNK